MGGALLFDEMLNVNSSPKNILILEPFFAGSHRQWCEGLKRFSKHYIEILSLPGRHWKWRMHGGALTLADRFHELAKRPDLIIASSMLDLTSFLALTRQKTHGIPVIYYMHENQINYPWSPQDRDVKRRRNNHYSFINYASAMAADKVWFNSDFHLNAFFDELPRFLRQFPDKQGRKNVDLIRSKSEVFPLGLDLRSLDAATLSSNPKEAVILWNHRWEYDKQPDAFFNTLFDLKDEGLSFKVIVAGERTDVYPPIFDEARQRFGSELVHFGYAQDRAEYARLLWLADILPVTSIHDFFGVSTVEAMYCNCVPLLPNRLAYPDYTPERFLYEEGEFKKRLRLLIQDLKSVRNTSTQNLVKHFCWSTMIAQYDAAFDYLVAK